MKRLQLILLLLAACTRSAGAQDLNETVARKFMSSIYNIVGLGDPRSVTAHQYLVTAMPGYIIDPGLDMSRPEDRAQLARVFDAVLAPSSVYSPRSEHTLDVYKNILRYKQPPDFKLTDDQEQKLNGAVRFLFKDGKRSKGRSDDYQRFWVLREAYANAQFAVDSYRRAHPGQSVPAPILTKLDEAKDDFDLAGRRNEILSAQETIRQYSQYDPNVWWEELNVQYTNNVERINNTDVPVYSFYPSYSKWMDPKTTWLPVTFDRHVQDTTQSSSATSVGGGGGLNLGLFSIGADASHQEQRTYSNSHVDNLTISFEITRVTIDRPWMEPLVFKSHAWRWAAGTPLDGQLISDPMDPNQGKTPGGLMPFLPTAILLARNVKVSGAITNDLITTFNQQTGGGGSVGFLCFSLGGHAASSSSSSYRHGDATSAGFEFKDPQIIGIFVEVLPKCPDPDKGLKF